MADNLDFTKKILVDIELKADQLKRDLPAVLVEIDELTQKQKKLTAESKIGTKEFVNNAQQLRNLKAEVRDTNKYIDNTTKAINFETNSIAKNRALLSLMTADFVKLNQAEGATAASTIQLGADIASLTDKLKAQEFEIKQTYRNVGNYTESINKSNIALKNAGGGIQVFSTIQEGLNKGFGFLPSAAGPATAALGLMSGTYGILNKAVQGFSAGFKTSEDLIIQAVAAEENLVAAKKNATAAILAEEEATAALEAGEISELAAKKASIDATKAQAAALEAQAIATETATVATAASSEGLRLFKIALASTGIGLLIVALASLAEYFTNTNDGAKEWTVISARVGAAADILKGKIAELGRELFNYREGLDGKKNDAPSVIGKYIKEVDEFGKKSKDADGNFKKILESVKDLQATSIGSESIFKKFFYKASGKSDPDSDLKKQIKEAQDAAEALARSRFALTVAERVYNNDQKIQEQTELGVQTRRIRNLHYDISERQAAAEKAKQISKSVFQTELQFAQENQKIVEGEQALRAKAGVKVDKVALAEAKGRILTLKGQFAQEQEMLDVREAKVEKQGETAAQKAEKLRQKQEAARLEALELEKESRAKELQDIYEEYGDRVIAADDQYNKELIKLKKFLTEKLITQGVYNQVEAQLASEHHSNVQKIIDDFNTQDKARYQQAQNELINLHIQGIKNDNERSIAAIKQKNDEQNQEIDKQNQQYRKNIAALEIEISQMEGAAQDEARLRRDNQLVAIQQNEQKRVELERQASQQIANIKRQETRDIVNSGDEAAVLQQKRGSNIFNNDSAKNAELNAITHTYDFQISEAARVGKATVLLEQQKIDAIKAINDKYNNEKIEYAVNVEQQIQSAAFDIISQGVQQSSQAALNTLAKSKDAELQNSNLTATQKKLINDKYQKLEDAEKRKAFYANQKLQAANVLINGAVAVSKTIAEMGFLPALPFVALTTALTALSIAKVLSAKPGFAQGGIKEHRSDGRGAMLPGYSRRDDTNAYLRSGEAVVVSEAMRVPWARNTVSRINEMFGGRSFAIPGVKTAFAAGGIFTDGGNSNRYYSQPVYDTQGLANSLAYQLINNFPPIVTDVKDIITQQSIYNRTIDRVNL